MGYEYKSNFMQFHRLAGEKGRYVYNCFEKQAREGEDGWRGQVKREGDSVSGETTEGLFIVVIA